MPGRKGVLRVAVRAFEPFEAGMQKTWALFEAAARTGLTLELQAFDLHGLHEALFESGGLREGAWDIAFMSTDWAPEAAARGELTDLAELLRVTPPEGFPEAWPDSLLRMQNVDGRVIGLPFHDGPECLIYRKDLLQGQHAVPETWEEFHETARQLHGAEENLSGAVFGAFPDGHNTVYDFCLQLWSRDGELFDGAGGVCLNTAPAREGLAFYRGMLRDQRAAHPRCLELDSIEAGLAFAHGEAALAVNWFGFAAMCETMADSRVKGKVGVARVPRGAGGRHVSLNAYWILGIGGASPHREVAWQFLRHCATAAMDKLVTLGGAIGCRKATWRDAEVNARIPFYRELEKFHEDARELPRFKRWPRVAAALDELMVDAIRTDIPEAALLERAEKKIAGLGA
jgi:multiple sugar transport system substrate-binding protein